VSTTIIRQPFTS